MITVETILKASEEQIKKYLELNKNCAKRFVDEKSVSPLPSFARIITGVRRCGKSTVVQMHFLKKSAFYLNFEDTSLYGFDTKDFEILNEAIEKFSEKNSCKYEHYYCCLYYIQNFREINRFSSCRGLR